MQKVDMQNELNSLAEKLRQSEIDRIRVEDEIDRLRGDLNAFFKEFHTINDSVGNSLGKLESLVVRALDSSGEEEGKDAVNQVAAATRELLSEYAALIAEYSSLYTLMRRAHRLEVAALEERATKQSLRKD